MKDAEVRAFAQPASRRSVFLIYGKDSYETTASRDGDLVWSGQNAFWKVMRQR
jgi:hypothetical protein